MLHKCLQRAPGHQTKSGMSWQQRLDGSFCFTLKSNMMLEDLRLLWIGFVNGYCILIEDIFTQLTCLLSILLNAPIWNPGNMLFNDHCVVNGDGLSYPASKSIVCSLLSWLINSTLLWVWVNPIYCSISASFCIICIIFHILNRLALNVKSDTVGRLYNAV